MTAKHVTAELWWPEIRDDGVYLVTANKDVVLKLCRPDRGSDVLIAGYIAGLQAAHVAQLQRESS